MKSGATLCPTIKSQKIFFTIAMALSQLQRCILAGGLLLTLGCTIFVFILLFRPSFVFGMGVWYGVRQKTLYVLVVNAARRRMSALSSDQKTYRGAALL